jgi:hypothetical protein
MRRFVSVVAFLLVLWFFIALGVLNTATKVELHCGPYTSVPRITRYLSVGENVGRIIHDLEAGVYTPKLVVEKVRDSMSLMFLFKTVIGAAGRGENAPEAATGWRNAGKEAQDQALASCCPTAIGLPQTPNTTPAPEAPWDPKSASFQQSGLTGADLAADAATQARFPSSQIPMAVAVAKLESTFNPRAHNNYGQGVFGMWQINKQAHQALIATGDPYDPYVNARMAYSVWQDAGGSWSPWSTKGAAARIASQYSDLAGNAPDSTPDGPSVTIDQAGTGMDVPSYCSPVVLGGGAVSSNGAMPTLIASLNPKGAGNWQGAVSVGASWYVIHATAGDRAQTVHQINGAGNEVSQMNLVGADHATGFGMIGSTVYASWGNEVRTVTYQAGKSVTKAQTTATGLRGQIGFDPSHTKAVLRNGNKYQAINMATRQPYGVQVKTETGMRQGFGMNGDTLYVLTGYIDKPVIVDSWSLTTGEQTGTQDITPQGFDHWEAEGVYGATVGIKVGRGNDRRQNVYKLNTAEPTQSTPVGTTGSRTVTSYGHTYSIPIPAGRAGVAINFALDQLGDKYVWGAHGPNAWDCSGLTAGAWGAAGVQITPQSGAQNRELKHVPMSQMQPGDVLWHPGHVQLYLGIIDGKRTVVEAPNPRKTVRIDQSEWMDVQSVLRPQAGTAA